MSLLFTAVALIHIPAWYIYVYIYECNCVYHLRGIGHGRFFHIRASSLDVVRGEESHPTVAKFV